MGATTGIGLIAGLGGALFETAEAQDDASDSIANLEQEKVGLQAQEKQRSIQRIGRVQNIIGANVALAASRGIAPSSGSFKAIAAKSFSDFQEDENMDKLNTALKEQYVDQKENAIQSEADASSVGSFLGVLSDIF
jgi:hypothetical protein